MNLSTLIRLSAVLATLAASAVVADAITITAMSGPDINGKVSYSGTQREAWLTSATSGWVEGDVTGTPGDTDITALFGGTWAKEGELKANGTNDLLTASLNTGAWGDGGAGIALNGDWSIDSSFWSTYGKAVISIHVGNGAGNPDWFIWEVKAGELSGDFYYKRLMGGGGGLSNIFLWGSGEPVEITTHKVPDSGYSMIMVGLGLLMIAFFRRKQR